MIDRQVMWSAIKQNAKLHFVNSNQKNEKRNKRRRRIKNC